MAITQEQAQTQLDAWIAASLAVSTGQSYKIGSRELVRANISEIQKQIIFWQNQVSKAASGRTGARVMAAVPRDR
ncbi:DUF6148 family protein [Paenibacillus anseongense]|uniref:DUF6148 family protein n=1 Tax=Paenibacillus anseongense TaxID=2682845 RepID=UPI002DBB927D|nr:DUF6148 family protein [Paenibacillus anseongense]MEC0269069.1 DUF6148 family protein [Paenibacillus anseongense]